MHNTCWFCGKPKGPIQELRVAMFGPRSRGVRTAFAHEHFFPRTTIAVPRCKRCRARHALTRAAGWLGLLITPAAVGLVLAIRVPREGQDSTSLAKLIGGWPTVGVFTLAAVLGRYVGIRLAGGGIRGCDMKSFRSHPEIAERLDAGWGFGQSSGEQEVVGGTVFEAGAFPKGGDLQDEREAQVPPPRNSNVEEQLLLLEGTDTRLAACRALAAAGAAAIEPLLARQKNADLTLKFTIARVLRDISLPPAQEAAGAFARRFENLLLDYWREMGRQLWETTGAQLSCDNCAEALSPDSTYRQVMARRVKCKACAAHSLKSWTLYPNYFGDGEIEAALELSERTGAGSPM